ncbi:zinc finger BED domain-containing protein RICESLEEPER 2-like [Oryza sativa Japonica Group]|uniref:zinc finger BED domain-containing protein RICESLEEPER 2-like n=1 Tax=Oryza sativa subsp. japonica TaxID=39947 RepID=UPI00339CCF0E
MWTSDNQKRGYMAITTHFIDESWALRNIIMRFIYVPSPHTAEVISDELYESLVQWNLDEKDGLEHLKDAIENIRDSVAYWTATPKRIEKFEDIAKFLNVTITNKLALDCKTRWNSTFNMLSVALPYKTVFTRASRVDKQYECEPTEEEWLFAEEKKIRLWSTCGNSLVEAMSVDMVEKFDKYWSDIQGLMGIATLFDPRFKSEMLYMCFEWLLGKTSALCDVEVSKVTTLLATLMDEYNVPEEEDNIEPSTLSLGSMEVISSFSERVARKRPASVRFQSELDRYLDDELIPISTKDFKVLDCTSGRVLSEHRSRLIAEMLEALMCLQDWIRNKYKVQHNGDPTSFWSCLQDIQEGLLFTDATIINLLLLLNYGDLVKCFMGYVPAAMLLCFIC